MLRDILQQYQLTWVRLCPRLAQRDCRCSTLQADMSILKMIAILYEASGRSLRDRLQVQHAESTQPQLPRLRHLPTGQPATDVV